MPSFKDLAFMSCLKKFSEESKVGIKMALTNETTAETDVKREHHAGAEFRESAVEACRHDSMDSDRGKDRCVKSEFDSQDLVKDGVVPSLALIGSGVQGESGSLKLQARGLNASAEFKLAGVMAKGDQVESIGDGIKFDTKKGPEAALRPEQLGRLDPARKAAFDSAYIGLNEKIKSGELKSNPKGIVPIHKNGGEVYDQDKLLWAISRPAEAAAPNVSAGDMPFTGPSTVDAEKFVSVLKQNGSSYADKREEVNVRRPDGSVGKVSLDMGQLAKLYEVKWREQGNIPLNSAALLAQSQHEIGLGNLDKLAQLPGNLGKAAVERTQETNQWAGIKTGKETFRCEADEKKWGQIADSHWAKDLGKSVWADKKETRVWDSPGKAMCGWFEHIGEKYVANGKDTARKIIPQYVGAEGGPHYIEGFAKLMKGIGQFKPVSLDELPSGTKSTQKQVDSMKVSDPNPKAVTEKAAAEKLATDKLAVERRTVAPEKVNDVPGKLPVILPASEQKTFKLPDTVTSKAHPEKGQGYHEPVKASFEQLLGREMTEGETKSVVAAAKAFRKSEGKSISQLSTNDMLLPTSKDGAKTFLEHVGDTKFGKQVLRNDKLEAFKQEIAKRFDDAGSNLVKPAVPEIPVKKATFEPSQENARSRVSGETVAQVAAKKLVVEPGPDLAKTKAPAELVVVPTPAADKARIELVVTDPSRNLPKLETLIPNSASKAGNGELAKPIGPGDEIENSHKGSCGCPGCCGKANFTPGNLSQNVEILSIAGSAKDDGVRILSDRDSLVRSKLTEPAGLDKDVPVAVVPGMQAGSLGLLSMRDKSGQEHLVPFVAGKLANGSGTQNDVVLNNEAAKRLGLPPAVDGLKRGSEGPISVISLDKNADYPKNKAELDRIVGERIKDVASKPEVLERAEKAFEGKDVVDNAYIPKPDMEYGYRRTVRSGKELRNLRATYTSEAQTNLELAESVKPGSPTAQATIQKVLEGAQAEKGKLKAEQAQLNDLYAKMKGGDIPSVDSLPKSTPAALRRDLELAEYNRKLVPQYKAAVVPVVGELTGENSKYLKQADLAEQYAKNREAAATKKAELYARIAGEKSDLQDRIISDATNPKFSQELLQHRFAMKAYAAEVMAANPDMTGALTGTRHVINAGHDPFHNRFTGFGAYPWSKGMTEYDFNKQTSAIQGAIIEYSGGTPIYVNQDELYKTNPATQTMEGLGAAMAAPKADTAISNHMDDFPGIKAGTMTMFDSQSGGAASGRLASLISQGKGVVGGEPIKAVRDTRGRGVQQASHGSVLILNEMLTTSPDDRSKLMDPRELAKLSMGMTIGISRFVHPPNKDKVRAEMEADKRNPSGSWDSYWAARKAKSANLGEPQVLPYPKIYK